jgi:hypothetical protein
MNILMDNFQRGEHGHVQLEKTFCYLQPVTTGATQIEYGEAEEACFWLPPRPRVFYDLGPAYDSR